ncbi:MAG: YraN family protein [Rhodospirillales bacterium]
MSPAADPQGDPRGDSAARGESAARKKAWRYGMLAETVCVIALRLRGYRVLARRYRTPLGEIDIIARRGDTLAFVEVKGRADIRGAADSISPRQRMRIQRAARAYLQRHPEHAARAIRFDAVLVAPGRWPVHVRDAWRPDDS